MKFKAIIVSTAYENGKAYTKNYANGNTGKYNLHSAKIIEEGPLKDMAVVASRTILNKDGDEKEPVEVDQQVTLHVRKIVGTNGEGYKYFFEVQTGEATLDDAEIEARLGALMQES